MRYSKGGVSITEAMDMDCVRIDAILGALTRLVERENELSKPKG